MINYDPKRAYQVLGLTLRKEISDGLYPVGSRLPPERDIAERLNVGRTVVREAIIMLELENLVEVKKGSGVYVINLPNVVNIRENEDVGPFEMLQARQLLESNIAEFAALQATPTDIERMREALEIEQDDLKNQVINPTGDKLFHLSIAQATQNSVLVDILKHEWDRRESSSMWNKLHCHIETTEYKEEWLKDHQNILIAMRKKSPVEAKHTMWQHLENVKNRLLELSDFDDPHFDGYLFESIPSIKITK